jgi:hypothetical protein
VQNAYRRHSNDALTSSQQVAPAKAGAPCLAADGGRSKPEEGEVNAVGAHSTALHCFFAVILAQARTHASAMIEPGSSLARG